MCVETYLSTLSVIVCSKLTQFLREVAGLFCTYSAVWPPLVLYSPCMLHVKVTPPPQPDTKRAIRTCSLKKHPLYISLELSHNAKSEATIFFFSFAHSLTQISEKDPWSINSTK